MNTGALLICDRNGKFGAEFAEQVTLFVDAIRAKFQSVEFILPYKAMSAGTLWALSGERIWMDRRAGSAR